MADKKEIPTLTSIVHAGDNDMYNHFDEQPFDDADIEEISASPLTENASFFENNEFENTEFGAVELDNSEELDDILSMNFDDESETAELSDSDFLTESLITSETADMERTDLQLTDSNKPEKNESPAPLSAENQSEKDEIKEKIDQAIADALPWIELNLKKQLYKKFDI
ncbi:hypothetical protein MNBD_GAMMA09-1010 [hydrothermal vent metagenome]|uniref:Uncharacterized protein n=1 Tax=hydrothermal vent metagenome TaxID=652676 RepID=A0A3B0XS42_9ZZZZ